MHIHVFQAACILRLECEKSDLKLNLQQPCKCINKRTKKEQKNRNKKTKKKKKEQKSSTPTGLVWDMAAISDTIDMTAVLSWENTLV